MVLGFSNMLDIIFISYDEPNADKNFALLKQRFPYARRVHGVKGIANAHFAAAKKANTKFFYVVDGDAVIVDDFNFDYKPSEYEADYVHVWEAQNPASKLLTYGYGGVKLFNKKFFKNVKTNNLDFTTTLAGGLKLMPQVACITEFNSDALHAYRGAFRECVKLYTTLQSATASNEMIAEATARLDAWLNPDECDFRKYIKDGACDGRNEAKRRELEHDLLFINDHDFMVKAFTSKYPELDISTSPEIKDDNPMKAELSFITRVAAILYDPIVEENLKMNELRDALSDGQLLSKNWLIDALELLIASSKINVTGTQPLKVAILGGWIGTLPLLMFCRNLPAIVTSIDLDARANSIAEKLNYDKPFSTQTDDMNNIDYSQFDIIINTSSEHIEDISGWRKLIPAGKIVVVQNNNFTHGHGHISNVRNSDDLCELLNLESILYEGTRKFALYDRFMLIGKS